MSETETGKRKKIGAGFVGAGGGTALTALIQSLSESNPYKHILLMAIPSLTVACGTIYYFCAKQCIDWYIEIRIKREQITVYKIANSRIKDQHASDDHKRHIQMRLEEFERAKLDAALKRIEQLAEDQKSLNKLRT